MTVTIYSSTHASRLQPTVNPGGGSGAPFATLDADGSDFYLSLDDGGLDELIRAATAARGMLDAYKSGAPHRFQPWERFGGHCAVCGTLPDNGIHQAPAQDELCDCGDDAASHHLAVGGQRTHCARCACPRYAVTRIKATAAAAPAPEDGGTRR